MCACRNGFFTIGYIHLASISDRRTSLIQQSAHASCTGARTLLFNDPRLLLLPLPLKQITDEVRRDAQALLQELLVTKSLALAAPIFGIPKRMLAFSHNGSGLVLLNPVIIQSSDMTLVLREKCACCPNLSWARWRPTKIRVQFSSMTGEIQTLSAQGPSAQLMAHHMEHLESPSPIWAMTTYEQAVASLAQFGMPIPNIMEDLFLSFEELRAPPGESVASRGNEEAGFKAVWKNERVLHLIEIVSGQEHIRASLDTRDHLHISSEADRRLVSFLSILAPQAKLLLAGVDDLLLHLNIAHLFPEFQIKISEEITDQLDFVQHIAGTAGQRFSTVSQPLKETLKQAKDSKFDAILMNGCNELIRHADIHSFEALVRAASKGLMSTGVMLLKYAGTSPDLEAHKATLVKVFPTVYVLEALDGVIFIGARSKLDLALWEGLAYKAFSQAWSNITFSPDLCHFEVVKATL